MIIAIALAFLCLAVMVYQDLKFRHIHVLAPALLFLTGGYMAWLNFGNQYLKIIAGNVVFLAITFFVLMAYMNLKNKSFINPFKNYFGLGDLLFYLAASPFFLLQHYMVFFIASLIFSLIAFYAFSKRVKAESIPLAGFASIALIGIISYDVLLTTPALTLIYMPWKLL